MAANRKLLCGLVLCACTLTAQDVARDAERALEDNHPQQALALYRKGVTENPGWTEGWWHVGTLLYDADDYAGAATAFGRAAALEPKSGQTWIMLGLSEAKLHQNAEAIDHLSQGRKLGIPDEPQLHHVVLYTLGMLWLEMGETRGGFDHAQETLDGLVRDKVESDELTTALGLAVLRQRPPGNDRDVVRAAGEAEVLAAQLERRMEARRAYQSLAATYPKVPGVQFAYGKFLVAIQLDDEAVAAFQRELQNSPNHVLARLGIVGLKSRTDAASALPYAEEAVKLAPDLPETHYLLGSLLIDVDVKRAIDELEIARKAEPNVAKVYFALSHAYTRANRAADASRARAEFARLDKQAVDTPN